MYHTSTPLYIGVCALLWYMVTCFRRKTIIQELCQIIEQARGQVAATANYAQTMMYWHIGERINREVLGNQRAEYGKQIVSAVSTQLSWSHFVEVIPLSDDLILFSHSHRRCNVKPVFEIFM